MNIKINKKEFDKLMSIKTDSYIIGSHMYGTNDAYSDLDILHTYKLEDIGGDIALNAFPIIHQFQYRYIQKHGKLSEFPGHKSHSQSSGCQN